MMTLIGDSIVGKVQFKEYLDSSGTPGPVTSNNTTGRAAVANGSSSCLVTNSRVTLTSIVVPVLETSGAGVAAIVAIPGNGSCTFVTVNGTGVATVTTADAKFSWIVFNI